MFVPAIRNLLAPARAGAAALALIGASTGLAHAGYDVTFSDPGVRYVDSTALCAGTTACYYGTEAFTDTGTAPGGAFTATTGTTAFVGGFNYTYGAGGQYSNTSAFSGTYSSAGFPDKWILQPQNEYGGTGGNAYPELFGPGGDQQSEYELTVNAPTDPSIPGANYFGIWISALDAYNDLLVTDSNGDTIKFDSAILLAALGSCDHPNPYCGNPTTSFNGQDSGELFAFVNVFDTTGYITDVLFFDGGGTGFESSNDTLGYINPVKPFGHALVPEPGSLAVLVGAIASAGLLWRRRRR